jgi:hypothetical protein
VEGFTITCKKCGKVFKFGDELSERFNIIDFLYDVFILCDCGNRVKRHYTDEETKPEGFTLSCNKCGFKVKHGEWDGERTISIVTCDGFIIHLKMICDCGNEARE